MYLLFWVLSTAYSVWRLGIKFYTGNMFPSAYKNVAFIAEHGSWNRVPLSGYRVMKVTLDGTAKVKDYSEFMTGFITRKGKVGGRPVDIAQLADGSLLVSDDYANRIYRVTYSGH
jgi:glucose/arabinose dehydrogenase